MASFSETLRQPVDVLGDSGVSSSDRPFSWQVFGGLAIAWLLAMSPIQSMGQSPVTRAPMLVSDVELGPNGEWSGVVVDSQGVGVARLPVRLRSGRGPGITAITNAEGRFAFTAVPTGTGWVEFDRSPRICRFWKNGTAPPKATRQLLLVSQGNVVRGVQGSRIYDWMSDHPVLTYAGIATAVVVPVAVIGSNHDRTPASP